MVLAARIDSILDAIFGVSYSVSKSLDLPKIGRAMVSPDHVSALFGSWVSFDARGMCPRETAASRRCGEISYRDEIARSSPQSSGVTGPSVARSGAADSDAPQMSAQVAQCRQLPRAVSGCLAPTATFFHRPGGMVASRSCSWSDEYEACSTQAKDRRGVWRLMATDE